MNVLPSEIPVEIVRPPQDAFQPPGADVVFEAELNKDRVEVKWLRNNMPVVQGDKHQMMSEGKVHRLQVCEIRPRDQGEYRIVAKDKDAKAKLELAGRDWTGAAARPAGGPVSGSRFPEGRCQGGTSSLGPSQSLM